MTKPDHDPTSTEENTATTQRKSKIRSWEFAVWAISGFALLNAGYLFMQSASYPGGIKYALGFTLGVGWAAFGIKLADHAEDRIEVTA